MLFSEIVNINFMLAFHAGNFFIINSLLIIVTCMTN